MPALKYSSDHVASDDLAVILEMSREHDASDGHPQAGPSQHHGEPSYLRKHALQKEVSALDAEIRELDDEIAKRKALRADLAAQREGILKQFTELQTTGRGQPSGKGKQRGTIDYASDGWEWAELLRKTMKRVFNIDRFRLCQEAVCNASMDGRDIICVMPTGGGKSLTFQLPALLSPGCSLVISPLISLISDQIAHLREAGVEAVKVTGSTSKTEAADIRARLIGNSSDDDERGDIKLCYVTPEKISKSKTFMAMLQTMEQKGRLARIVIDEAHCVSEMGHDFRPDYKELSKLRVLFPRVPILCLSATCPPKVRKDILHILRLQPVLETEGGSSASGTVYFSAPLYRKNLHYAVLPKPAAAKDALQAMARYILDHHAQDSGIVYCFRKKDTEDVAEGLVKWSKGRVQTGVYHADIGDAEKERLHARWRKGEIKVVCATIAFGLGIDKGDVRFVLHHSMSKSLEGFYQETGRAGRDGGDADCVLYYRPQDASSLSALMYRDRNGMDKLLEMLRFSHDVEECRKIQFAKHFSASSQLSLGEWETDGSTVLKRCGHCDNCTRAPEMLDRRDVTLEAWKILTVAQAVEGEGGRVTLGMMSDLVRGAGGGAFAVVNGGGGKRGKMKAKDKVELDLGAVAGGKIGLSKDDAETLMVELLLGRYLEESFSATAYTTNVYVVPGRQAVRLTRLSVDDVQAGRGPRIMCCFVKKTKVAKQPSSARKASKKAAAAGDSDEGEVWPPPRKPRKRPRVAVDDEEDESWVNDDADPGVKGRPREQAGASSESDFVPDGGDDWDMAVTADKPKKRPRGAPRASATRRNSSRRPQADDDVISVSSG